MKGSSDILAALVKAAQYLTNAIQTKLNSGDYPTGDSERGFTSIQEAMSIGSPQQESDRSYIDIIIDMSDNVAPYAAAYEFGSGIHSTKGSKETYPIVPVEAGALALRGNGKPWIPSNPIGAMRSKKFVDYNDADGVFIFSRVDHPGIRPNPYIVPTVEKEKDEIVKIMGKELDYAIYKMVFGDTPTTETFVVKI